MGGGKEGAKKRKCQPGLYICVQIDDVDDSLSLPIMPHERR